ncbi:BCCT family transporter [uncultured Cobetia sp.]|uniref:BCCT family transporter n=1 Tax=uncultured Cobetia sp. TaxID=410706 RepID=UPI0025952161|nr:BCCT family transporter [uncultured Cobetia sp.]
MTTDTSSSRQPEATTDSVCGLGDTDSAKGKYLTSIATVAVITLLIGAAALFPTGFLAALDAVKTSVIGNLGFIFTWPAFAISLVMVAVCFTPLGKLRFGEGEPEFHTLSWMGMLFATGMGIGLLTWGVLEPKYHTDAGQNTDMALLNAFNHWGLLAWAGYLAIGALFAHAMYNMKMAKPAEELLGNGQWSKLNLVSLVVSTVIGLSLSFTYATTPIQQGLVKLVGIEFSPTLIICVLAMCAIVSSASGLKRGIKWLSNYNTLFAIILMIGVLVLTVPGDILSTFVRLVPEYLLKYPAMATDIGLGDPERKTWLADWLYAFEAAWYGWFIFTGVFIARISKGRTLRGMVLGVMLVPTLFSCLWFVVFGLGSLSLGVDDVFKLIDTIDSSGLLSLILTLNILLFFITSADSAGLVCEMLTVKRSRAFWIVSMAALAVVVSWLGGDVYKTLLSLISVAAIPVAFGIFALVIAFVIRVRRDRATRAAPAPAPLTQR